MGMSQRGREREYDAVVLVDALCWRFDFGGGGDCAGTDHAAGGDQAIAS